MAATVYKLLAKPDMVIELVNPVENFAPWEPSTTSTSINVAVNRTETVDQHMLKKDGAKAVHYHVSSQVMQLASPRYMQMLDGGKWVESSRQADGLFHTKSEGLDAEAYLIILKVLHLRHREVPKSLGLEMLAKVAVIVDFYELEEAVAHYSETWINALKFKLAIGQTYCRDLLLWIVITRVFGLKQEFEQATKVALLECDEPMRTLDLPIWPSIVEEIDSRRNGLIKALIDSLHSLLLAYQNPDYECPTMPKSSFECRSMFFGALNIQMAEKRLAFPRPDVPFRGLSVNKILTGVQQFRNPSWAHKTQNCHGREDSNVHKCSLNVVLQSKVLSIAGALRGLDLKASYTRVKISSVTWPSFFNNPAQNLKLTNTPSSAAGAFRFGG